MTYPNLERKRNNEALPASYTAFLLRCWQEDANGEPAWRFTLVQAAEKGSMHGFASLDAVVNYLKQTLTALDHKLSGGKHP